MVIHHIDMVILDIHMGYGIPLWERTVSILSSFNIDIGYFVTLVIEHKHSTPDLVACGRMTP